MLLDPRLSTSVIHHVNIEKARKRSNEIFKQLEALISHTTDGRASNY